MSDRKSDGHDARSRVGEFVAPGRLVTVNGHQVHYVETGSGGPTVVFESGMGSNHLDWQEVKARLSPATHAFFYDRAGLGWSEPHPEPDAQQVVRSLRPS
jgi:pimeloyl-ACP methyl ester carboxylesterase